MTEHRRSDRRSPPTAPRRGRQLAAAVCALFLLPQAARAAEGDVVVVRPQTPAETLRAEALRHEHGEEGAARDPQRAAALYCKAAQLGDATSQYNLGWMYANGRGLERNDAWAAYFFRAAAEQGIDQAARMLTKLGGSSQEVPDCMRPQERPAVVAAKGAAVPPPRPAAVLLPPPPPARPQVRIVPPKAIAGLVQTLAPAYGIEPELAYAIIKAESNFDPLALSPKNAMGLMQLIPETAERFQVKDAFDPKQNIRGGLAYLRWLLAYFQGDLALVAAAYNAGEGAVERHRGVPPYAETRNYVARVLAAVGKPVHPFDAKAARPSPKLALIHRPSAYADAAGAAAGAAMALVPVVRTMTALASGAVVGDAPRVRVTIERRLR